MLLLMQFVRGCLQRCSLATHEEEQCTSCACTPLACHCQAHYLSLGTECDDADAATVGDACDGEGRCRGTQVTDATLSVVFWDANNLGDALSSIVVHLLSGLRVVNELRTNASPPTYSVIGSIR